MRTYTFDLEDKTYTLKYDYNSICDMEELGGVPVQVMFSEGSVGLNQVRILLWGGLKWKLNGITKQQAGFIVQKLIEENKYEDVVQNAMKLIADSFPKSKGTEDSVGE